MSQPEREESLRKQLFELTEDTLVAWRTIRIVVGNLELESLQLLVNELVAYAGSSEHLADQVELDTTVARLRLEALAEHIESMSRRPENPPVERPSTNYGPDVPAAGDS